MITSFYEKKKSRKQTQKLQLLSCNWLPLIPAATRLVHIFFSLLGPESLALLQAHCLGYSTLNCPGGTAWYHLCIEFCVIRSWRLTFEVRFLLILWASTTTPIATLTATHTETMKTDIHGRVSSDSVSICTHTHTHTLSCKPPLLLTFSGYFSYFALT